LLWTLDGRQIYFTELKDSGSALRKLTIGEKAVTDFENPSSFTNFHDVTSDGRYVVFESTAGSIWIQRVVNPGERRALVQGPFTAAQARVSPDGRWLAYSYFVPGGVQIVVQPFDRPGERIQVSVKGGHGPVWRDDSRELYYEGPEGLMAIAMSERGGVLEAGTPQKLFSVHTKYSGSNNVEVAAHGRKFLVNTIDGDSDNVPLEVTLNWTMGLKK